MLIHHLKPQELKEVPHMVSAYIWTFFSMGRIIHFCIEIILICAFPPYAFLSGSTCVVNRFFFPSARDLLRDTANGRIE